MPNKAFGHRQMPSELTQQVVPPAHYRLALGRHRNVVGPIPLPNRPPSHGPIRRVPLHDSQELALGHPTRLIVWRRFHPLSRLGGVRLSGFLRRPRATGFGSALASNSHDFLIMLCSLKVSAPTVVCRRWGVVPLQRGWFAFVADLGDSTMPLPGLPFPSSILPPAETSLAPSRGCRSRSFASPKPLQLAPPHHRGLSRRFCSRPCIAESPRKFSRRPDSAPLVCR
jgi:hypothetical protein